MQLSSDQLRAAVASPGRIYVEAAPGTGKTTVAAERFGILRYGPPKLRPVLCLSFTRSATAELRERILRRWGKTALSWQHRVITFDAFHRSVLEFLLRSGAITWFGGHTSLGVLDTWRGQEGARRIRKGDWWRTVYVRAGQVYSQATPAEDDCFAYSRKGAFEAALGGGNCTHAEVRQALLSALGDARIQDSVNAFIGRQCRSLIIDEFFDADEADLAIIRAACRGSISVTAIGDPWQAIYEFRGARPELAMEFLSAGDFTPSPLSESFRYKTEELRTLATTLRRGVGVVIRNLGDERSDVVLGNTWAPLWRAPSNILPLSFGPISTLTDALLTLLLDSVTRAYFSRRAIYSIEAIEMLRLDAVCSDIERLESLGPIVSMLSEESRSPDGCFDELRKVVKKLGCPRTLRKLPPAPSAERKHLEALRRRLQHVDGLIPGLTVHQAKGREWDVVGVKLTPAQATSVSRGLQLASDQDRLAYVALTRARSKVGLV